MGVVSGCRRSEVLRGFCPFEEVTVECRQRIVGDMHCGFTARRMGSVRNLIATDLEIRLRISGLAWGS